MSELKQFYNNLDFDFSELMKSLHKAQQGKEGSLDAIFRIDEFVNLCRWFLGDALRAVEKMPKDAFEDRSHVVAFQEKLAGIVAEVNVPFSILQRKRQELWQKLSVEVSELVEMM